MGAGINPMSSLPRPRTRNQWDKHYKNLYCKSGGLGRRDNGVKNVDEGGKDSWEKQGFVIIGERRGLKRTRNVVDSSASPSNVRGYGRERAEEEKKNNVASVGRVLRGRKILDVRSDTDSDGVLKSDDDDIEFLGVLKSDDDEIEFLGERVVSNGSSLKNGENGVKRGRGRPRIKPLDDERVSTDVSVDSEKFKDSEDLLSKSSDESDDLSLSEDESTSEEDDEFSDEDYKASSSDSSYVSYYSSDDDEQEKKDGASENVNVMNGEEDNSSDAIEDKTTFCSHGKSVRVKEEKESDTEQEENDESDDDSSISRRCSNQQKGKDEVIIISDDDKFPSVRKSRRTIGKKESEVEQERDDGIRKGRHAIHDDGFCNKTSANWKIEDEVIKLPSFRKSSRINPNGDAELAGLARSDKACSMKKARKDGFKDNGKDDLSSAKCYKPTTFPKFQKKDLEFGKFISSPFPIPESGKFAFSMDNKFKSLRDEDSCHIERVSGEKEFKLSKKKNSQARTLDLIKILVESINSLKEDQSPIEENDLMTQSTLPLRFRFEDEVKPPRVKSDWEKEMDSLFGDLELGLRESEIECTNNPTVTEDDDISPEIDQSPAACCGRGEHEPILDEQIGIICKYCAVVILDIKYVLPPFYTPPLSRRDWRDYDESPNNVFGEIHFRDSGCKTPEPTRPARGTVWDLIAGVEKELYPHQREGFEFMWKNIAGDIMIEKMKYPLSGGRGCIISHAPGTGKTRLTIVFLQAFLKLYPTCRPVIIAPKGMLLTWESEFIKWNANIPFHNLNKKELSENEYSFAAEIIGQVGGKMSKDCVRILKLASWMFGRSILGISYQLFVKLVGENRKVVGLNEQIRKLLLERPGLLVLDEGHTPRNDQSRIWKALSKVSTQRRIILSGTPFQNNLTELYNTLCVVNPKFVNQMKSENKMRWETRGRKSSVARKKWMDLTSSIGKDTNDGLKKLKAMLDPFVHVHKGTILKESLPGLRDTLVFLHPTELQKNLLEASTKTRNIFHRVREVSLVSVHPSLMLTKKLSPDLKSELEAIEKVIDAGVKLKFVMKLIRLADALGERVLIFSQFIDPLVFIRKQIKSRFSWKEGRELLYMDGQLDEKQRQDSICSFNDDKSEAKVLLASERACSEGINLIGASRVVLLDTVWNPSVEKQAVSRAYRLGQKKVVYVYRLFTSGTEVGQYAQQVQKERMSQLIFSPGDGETCRDDESLEVSEDKVLEAMLGHERFSRIFEKIIRQPKESDLIEIFG